jgi:hypothetical protein
MKSPEIQIHVSMSDSPLVHVEHYHTQGDVSVFAQLLIGFVWVLSRYIFLIILGPFR